MSDSEPPWPTELRLRDGGAALSIAFADGSGFLLPAELLRVESPSAEVQGHGPGERKVIGGKRNVRIGTVQPVGNYAVKLVFDDGHDTGLFTWRFLHALGGGMEARWAAYLAALEARGLSRDAPAPVAGARAPTRKGR